MTCKNNIALASECEYNEIVELVLSLTADERAEVLQYIHQKGYA